VAGRTPLLVALALDNLGSGLFLPLTLVYLTTVTGLPVGTAGGVVTAGTVVGLAAPPLAGRLVDRVGPRAVVAGAQVVQAAGTALYLAASGPGTALLAAAVTAAGTQAFYSSLFALVADVAPEGPADASFALVDGVRSGAFGLGALLSAVALSVTPGTGLRAALVVDAGTFLLSAALLGALVRPRRAARVVAEPTARVLADRPFLLLVAVTALLALAGDLFLVGLPVYALQVVGTARWVPGACLALLTALIAALAPVVVRATRSWARTTAMAAGAGCLVGWAVVTALASALPGRAAVAVLLLGTLVLAAGSVLVGTRATALAEAAAPPAVRGRYLATFQYAFTVAVLLAPALAAGLDVAAWLPWLVVAGTSATALGLLPVLARRLPQAAVRAR
jgi:Na+/melibiose symporter-like transporter